MAKSQIGEDFFKRVDPKTTAPTLPVDSDNCQLWHADCLGKLADMTDHSVHAVITDPPYNVGMRYGKSRDSMPQDVYREWSTQWLRECLRVCQGPVVFTPGIVNLSMWYRIDPPPKWMMCWYKSFSRSRSPVGCNNWEPILFYGKPPRRNGSDVIKAIVVPEWDAHRHPCPKPLQWAKDLVNLLTKEGQIILDPFMGSGTTGLACLRLKRRFIGIEKEAEYYEMARRRMHFVDNRINSKVARKGDRHD